MLKRFPKDETMVNVKKTKQIFEDEKYVKIIAILRKHNKYISESEIALERYGDPVSDSERKCLRKKLNLMVRENVLISMTRETLVKKIHYTPNKVLSRKKVYGFIFYDYGKKAQRYYYYPKYTNLLVTRLKKMYDDIEMHNLLVPDEDMVQIKRHIVNFSELFSTYESTRNIARYNLEKEKLLEKVPRIAAVLNEEIKLKCEPPALFNILNRMVNQDLAMRFIFWMSKTNMYTLKESFNEINSMFSILQKYHNSNSLATEYLSDLEIHTVSVWYKISEEDMHSQDIDMLLLSEINKRSGKSSKLRTFFHKLINSRNK